MPGFDAVFHYNDHGRDAFLRRMAEQVPAHARVLDAGAGSCRYRKLFAHCHYETQDFCQYQGEDSVYGRIDHVCDITRIPVTDASFDWVFCTEVLEHLPRPDLAVQEFSRILRPGGTLVLTAPLPSGVHLAPYHFYGGFSRYWYQHFLPQHGFDITQCVENGGFFKLYGQESQRFPVLLRPRSRWARALYLPLELVISLWFRLAVPIACHLLDPLDRQRDFTAGYFVVARKGTP